MGKKTGGGGRRVASARTAPDAMSTFERGIYKKAQKGNIQTYSTSAAALRVGNNAAEVINQASIRGDSVSGTYILGLDARNNVTYIPGVTVRAEGMPAARRALRRDGRRSVKSNDILFEGLLVR